MLSTKKIVTAYREAVFSKNTVEAKIKAHYKDPKLSQNVSIKLRLKKDEVIWMSGSFLGFPLAKIKITPTSVQFYEKIRKTYFDGDFSLISKALGTELNFEQVQNILIGESLLPLNNKHNSEIEGQSYLITPKNQASLFELFYWLNPSHYKLDKQVLTTLENQSLTVEYPKYQVISEEYFPETINITAKQPKQTTNIDLEYKNVVFDKELRFPFEIPSNYKEIRLPK